MWSWLKPNVEKLKKKGKTPELIELIFSEDGDVSARAEEAVVSLGERSVPGLIKLLRHKYEELHYRPPPNKFQRKATELLKLIGHPAVIGLVDSLNDDDVWNPARCLAAETLGIIGDPFALDSLIENMHDMDCIHTVRKACVLALGKIGSARALDALVHTLASDERGSVRATAAFALGELGDPTAIGPLWEAYKFGHTEAGEALKKLGEELPEY
jgi:HEAT repeat protein